MEIEAKVKVEDLEKIKQELINLGAKFGEPKTQEDRYFYPKENVGKVQGPGSLVLRIRKSKNCFLTFKALTERLGVWDEHEVIIDDPEIMKTILEKSGFVEVLHLVKSRIKGHLGEYELCLDDLKDTGKYFEVALEDMDKVEARKKLLELLNKLKFKEENIEHRGYGEILLAENGVKFNNNMK